MMRRLGIFEGGILDPEPPRPVAHRLDGTDCPTPATLRHPRHWVGLRPTSQPGDKIGPQVAPSVRPVMAVRQVGRSQVTSLCQTAMASTLATVATCSLFYWERSRPSAPAHAASVELASVQAAPVAAARPVTKPEPRAEPQIAAPAQPAADAAAQGTAPSPAGEAEIPRPAPAPQPQLASAADETAPPSPAPAEERAQPEAAAAPADAPAAPMVHAPRVLNVTAMARLPDTPEEAAAPATSPAPIRRHGARLAMHAPAPTPWRAEPKLRLARPTAASGSLPHWLTVEHPHARPRVMSEPFHTLTVPGHAAPAAIAPARVAEVQGDDEELQPQNDPPPTYTRPTRWYGGPTYRSYQRYNPYQGYGYRPAYGNPYAGYYGGPYGPPGYGYPYRPSPPNDVTID